MGVLYVRRYFDEKTRQEAINLVENIRKAFINMLKSVSWMDDRTRERAIKKAQSLRSNVGYQSLLDDWLLSLEGEYSNLEMDADNFLGNILRLEVFDNDYLFNLLRIPIDTNETDILMNPADVNAHYAFTENTICMSIKYLSRHQ